MEIESNCFYQVKTQSNQNLRLVIKEMQSPTWWHPDLLASNAVTISHGIQAPFNGLEDRPPTTNKDHVPTYGSTNKSPETIS